MHLRRAIDQRCHNEGDWRVRRECRASSAGPYGTPERRPHCIHILTRYAFDPPPSLPAQSRTCAANTENIPFARHPERGELAGILVPAERGNVQVEREGRVRARAAILGQFPPLGLLGGAAVVPRRGRVRPPGSAARAEPEGQDRRRGGTGPQILQGGGENASSRFFHLIICGAWYRTPVGIR